MSTYTSLKVWEIKYSAGNIDFGREFHRTEAIGKNETPQQTILGLLMLVQNLKANTASLELRGHRKSCEILVVSSLEPLWYL